MKYEKLRPFFAAEKGVYAQRAISGGKERNQEGKEGFGVKGEILSASKKEEDRGRVNAKKCLGPRKEVTFKSKRSAIGEVPGRITQGWGTNNGGKEV